ncbi:sulfatase [Sinomicrobium weinanense]|uniref:Sulfatase n=1 Tax=Sinomicrobium weinanense TaxID=2842200 RepID=A0A926JTD8_9FLAO|nr:sulfatase [Sinomicrobium weinanense]MBC9797177.1 sulfatase [Sinomicrobium weinanense]MBU3125847.1 sulfatase [Sinomicrobium weinanense]
MITGCLFMACTPRSKPVPSSPNIILINVDDLGWKDLGFMGSNYYETPNLDAFSKEGMVFTNAYASAANCAPSRACMISGLNTPEHGVYTVGSSARGDQRTRKLVPIRNTKYLKDSVYTLPEMLKSAGYLTASFGKWHIGTNPASQGIDYNIGGSDRGAPGKKGYFSPYNIDFIEDGPEGEYLTDRLTSEAITFLEENRDTTFFLYLPYYTVHTPIMGKPGLIEKFKDKKGNDGQNRPEYAAMVASMDENIGRILKTIDRLKLGRNTWIIFTSDNGGIRAVSEQNPLRAGKGSYYEGGIRVPLVMRWPGHIPESTVNTNRVTNLDFYPTIQEIVGPQQKAPHLDGLSLVSQFKDTTRVNRDLFFHFPVYLQAYDKTKDDGRDPLFRTRPGSVMISGDWKLHEYFEDGARELYYLKTDTGERNNLIDTYPEKARELYDKLVKWRTGKKAPVPQKKNPEYDARFEREILSKVAGAKP